MIDKHIILLVHITDRITHVNPVQGLFTEYGCNIRTRLGLHDTGNGFCSSNGVIVLEMIGDEVKSEELTDKLNAVEGVEVKRIVFDHP